MEHNGGYANNLMLEWCVKFFSAFTYKPSLGIISWG